MLAVAAYVLPEARASHMLSLFFWDLLQPDSVARGEEGSKVGRKIKICRGFGYRSLNNELQDWMRYLN
jgi:hypothetical protein